MLITRYSFYERKKDVLPHRLTQSDFSLLQLRQNWPAGPWLCCSMKHQVFTELTFFPWFSGWLFLRFVTLPFGMRCMCFLQCAVMWLAILFKCINFVNTIIIPSLHLPETVFSCCFVISSDLLISNSFHNTTACYLSSRPFKSLPVTSITTL